MLPRTPRAEARWEKRTRAPLPLAPSTFPPDAVAVIYRPARSAMTSGKARMGQWKLRFEARSAPFIEPLMGWTGSEDTLSQVELAFPSAEEAVAYARRQGLNYVLRGSDAPQATICPMGHPRRRLEWVERMIEPQISRTTALAGAEPWSVYASPGALLRDIDLSPTAKRDALHRWGFELIERARSNADNATERAQLDAVIDALLDLEEVSTGVQAADKGPRRSDRWMPLRSAVAI